MFIVFITYLDSIVDETERFNAFVLMQKQVYDLSKTSIVQAAWNGFESIHGWFTD
jgi:uncharacterized protein YjfI (DUF2170 family)